MRPGLYRELEVPEAMAGMRVDRYLAARFPDRSRSWLARGIADGHVRDEGDRPLRASARLRSGARLRLYLEGIAPAEPPPPLPPVLHEDPQVVVFDKPAGLLAHPSGTDFVWALVGMAKARWPDDRVDLVHRLDRDTSGALTVTRTLEANRTLKAAFKDGGVHKEYLALVRGSVPWDREVLDGPIGPAEGEIRIQMAVRDDGLPARTEVEVLGRRGPLSLVRCVIATGRTHQIRVHLAHAGHGVVGDRLYGVDPSVFLAAWRDHDRDRERVEAAAGAPRQALHCHRLVMPHPDGSRLEVQAPFPPDMQRWWDDPSCLPGG